MIRPVAAFCGLSLLSALAFGTAGAAESGWSAPKCGAEPESPVVKAGTVAQYNESVDRVTAYEKEARAYNACVSGQANREETAISQEASAKISRIHSASAAVQTHIAGSFQKLSSELTAAGRKLGHH
ncbi:MULTISPECIES: hypothetical protein [unclassified Gluconobacter]|uniref:hypothetical protein n=1 Tax=unclassified Gluconobacter TaxID=2644261 RepID=UPI00175A96D8|nr:MULTISPECIES: hypothetical protein [unclassified Gluconobacter]GFE95541.1 hypothetical protein DmGdi_06140 [Gluconobacter sp. Gdi]